MLVRQPKTAVFLRKLPKLPRRQSVEVFDLFVFELVWESGGPGDHNIAYFLITDELICCTRSLQACEEDRNQNRQICS